MKSQDLFQFLCEIQDAATGEYVCRHIHRTPDGKIRRKPPGTRHSAVPLAAKKGCGKPATSFS